MHATEQFLVSNNQVVGLVRANSIKIMDSVQKRLQSIFVISLVREHTKRENCWLLTWQLWQVFHDLVFQTHGFLCGVHSLLLSIDHVSEYLFLQADDSGFFLFRKLNSPYCEGFLACLRRTIEANTILIYFPDCLDVNFISTTACLVNGFRSRLFPFSYCAWMHELVDIFLVDQWRKHTRPWHRN